MINSNENSRDASSSSYKKRSNSQSRMDNQKRQTLTTNENSMNNGNIITVVSLSPLADYISSQNDRYTNLLNCFSTTPCLYLYGIVPDNIEVEMTMVCKNSVGKYCYSFYQFQIYDHLLNTYYERTLRRTVKPIDVRENIYKIELGEIHIRKQNNTTNQRIDLKKTFNKLFLYPSGRETSEKRQGPTQLVQENKCNCLQLALRFFADGKLLPIKSCNEVIDQTIWLSSKIEAVREFTKAMNAPTINAGNSKKLLEIFSSWNYHHQNCEMKFLMKVPREFYKMLDYGDIWISTSLVDKNNEPNRIYYFYANGIFYAQTHLVIDKALFKEGGYTEGKYYYLGSRTVGRKPLAELRKNPDMREQFKSGNNLAWYTLPDDDFKKMFVASGLNTFHLKFKVSCDIKLLDMRFQLPIDDLPPWLSDEFIEDVFNDPSVQHSSGFVESHPINVDALSLIDTGEGLIGIGDPFSSDTGEGLIGIGDPLLSDTGGDLFDIDDPFLSGTIGYRNSINISLLPGTVKDSIGIDLNAEPDYSLRLPTTRATTQKNKNDEHQQ